MKLSKVPTSFWINWLKIASIFSMLFGLAFVIFPNFTNQGFSLLYYSNADQIAFFDKQATSYISLLHAVLGAVLFGWFFMVFLVVRGPFAQGVKGSWMLIALPLNAWFIPDTTYSLLSGFWQNAFLNFVFYIGFMTPLLATLKLFRFELDKKSI